LGNPFGVYIFYFISHRLKPVAIDGKPLRGNKTRENNRFSLRGKPRITMDF
jgi:hypothetical protein